MKIILFGSSGQLGLSFMKKVPKKLEIITPLRSEIDLSIKDDIEKFIVQHNPKIILNFAAFTDVDKAETHQKLAFNINARAPSIISSCAKKIGAIFVHISSDYVYNDSKNQYLVEENEIKPKNIYGKSKALGEKLIKENCKQFIILRTSWLYSSKKRNFFTTISKLIKTKDCIKVVNDQIGSPTLVDDLVDAVLIILNFLLKEKLNYKNSNKMWGIYNLSSSGETSWYKFASIIADKMGYNSKLKIIPINSKDYSAVAERPLNSRLDNSKIFNIFGIKLPNWEDSFHNFFKNNTKEFK